MFWGLNLKPNRKYTQTVSKSFHISQAALDTTSIQDGVNQIFISFDNQKFLICTLDRDNVKQFMLDLNFAEGDEICFQSIGSGNVSLSGYMLVQMEGDDDSDGDESDDEAEKMSPQDMTDLRNALNKATNKKAGKAANNSGGDDEEDSDSEDDEDFDLEAEEDEEPESAEDEEEEDDEENDDEEEVAPPKSKQPKLEKHQKQQNGVAKENATADKKGKHNKKGKNETQQQQQPQQQQKAGGVRTLTGGVKVEDVRTGNGPEVKTGNRVTVYYEGRFKSNNKVFDSLKQGSGFKFSVGRGEVIKGWDVGVVGMKVGGKRRITCPAHMAYGSSGQPPAIPPNSTLVFDVELKATK